MMLIEETAVLPAALPLAEFKTHLRLGTGFTDDDIQDALMESFLRAGISAIEARTGKILIERSFSLTLSQWRDVSGHPFPLAPVSAITSLRLRDRADEEEVVDPAHYRLEADAHRPMIRPAGAVLPVIPLGGTVEIGLVAGLAVDWAGLPADLGQAVLLLAAHYYENRNETALGGGCMPFGVTSLIERYRTIRLFGGGAS
ncbi:head-tail connector protein [uncultured Roseovarius sp.]|uniref:head-tail connector protein n=1 Tax=uncultured Roseovarius sp. TaxID=293344 RepID=UPI00262FF13C|nr:head-tail connector protein [uncultured Roseovarius sp.]